MQTESFDELFRIMRERTRNKFWQAQMLDIPIRTLRKRAVIVFDEPVAPVVAEPIVRVRKEKKAKKSQGEAKLKKAFTDRQLEIAIMALERNQKK